MPKLHRQDRQRLLSQAGRFATIAHLTGLAHTNLREALECCNTTSNKLLARALQGALYSAAVAAQIALEAQVAAIDSAGYDDDIDKGTSL